MTCWRSPTFTIGYPWLSVSYGTNRERSGDDVCHLQPPPAPIYIVVSREPLQKQGMSPEGRAVITGDRTTHRHQS